MKTRRWILGAGSMTALAGGVILGSRPAKAEILEMTAPRAAHAVVGLADGSVLFIGGCVRHGCEPGPASATVDRYDPETRTIGAFGSLLAPRVDAAVEPLADGRVLLAGGWISSRVTSSVELFDPERRESIRIGDMSAAQGCRPVTLADGRVLLLGEQTVDIFNPQTLSLRQLTDKSPYLEASTNTLLDDGRVLVVGGRIGQPPRADAYLLDPADGSFMSTGSLAAPRRKHAAVKLTDGRVLIVGGADGRDRNGGKMKALELYDPETGAFSTVGNMQEARYKIVDAALLMKDGRVLVLGGAEKPEIIDPQSWTSKLVDVRIGETLNFAAAAMLPNGDVIVAGGYGEQTISPTRNAWLIPHTALA